MESDNSTKFLRSCLNGLNALTGIGLLSIPYAVSQGGWISLVGLFAVTVVCFYTGLLLKRCMDVVDPNSLIRTYPDIGYRAFGPKGRALVCLFLYLELFLVVVEFLILEGQSFRKLFPDSHILGTWIGGERAFIIITALIILPTTWLRSLSVLAYVSATGILASVVLIVTTVWIAAFEGVGFRRNGVAWRFEGLSTAMSMYTFCYCGHTVFPTLCTSMRNKNQFTKVLLVCFILSTISYVSMAVLGYLMYGDDLKSPVILNFPIKSLASKIAIYTTIVNPITKYPLMIDPIATAIEETLTQHGYRPFRIVVRTSIVIATVVVALVVPFFEHVMSFIGSFLGISCSILFPCIFYLKINMRSKPFGIECIYIILLIVFGLYIGATGTYTSVRNIVRGL